MYYVYKRSTQELVAKWPIGCEVMLSFYNTTNYEVVIW
jgi:hypothetical protein